VAINEGMIAYYSTLALTFCSMLRKWANIKKTNFKVVKIIKGTGHGNQP
jgi:hypothetical protein